MPRSLQGDHVAGDIKLSFRRRCIHNHCTGREIKLGFHLQVKDKSRIMLLQEICQFIEPESRIISDAMASYRRLPEHSYEHGIVVHDCEFWTLFEDIFLSRVLGA